MSDRLPNREQAIQLLRKANCPVQVVHHCLAVTDLALQIAIKLQRRGHKVNLRLVETGALLHDIGRAKTNTVDHAIAGGELAQSLGLPQPVVQIIKSHVGAGITQKEAAELGWPQDSYVPASLEEKIVSYADKRIEQQKIIPIEVEIMRLRNEGKLEAAERVRKLHEEMIELLGEEI
ncbi:MAG: HDIG domain-containing protein [Candidatus Bathyarchaeota archaeon]|nr:HDIG domain-containing protein [Candidatus Bathyarchaeota archaeon]